jgi:hypothetical protein
MALIETATVVVSKDELLSRVRQGGTVHEKQQRAQDCRAAQRL